MSIEPTFGDDVSLLSWLSETHRQAWGRHDLDTQIRCLQIKAELTGQPWPPASPPPQPVDDEHYVYADRRRADRGWELTIGD